MHTSFENFTPNVLNDVLEQFYANFKTVHAGPSNISIMRDIRDGLFTHLRSVSNAWRDYLSQPANLQISDQVIESLNIQKGHQGSKLKRFSSLKIAMNANDVTRLMNSGLFDIGNPSGLFRKVWFDLTIHLGIGGQAAMRSLTFESFVPETDETGRRYYRLNRDGMDQRQARSGMEMQYWNWGGRMYEMPGDPHCPVKSMDLYYQKRNVLKDSFFQRPKSCFQSSEGPWFESPVGHSALACLMTKMSEESGMERSYSNSSLKVTLAEMLQVELQHDVDRILGCDPRNKTSKGPQGSVPLMTSEELYANSLLIHRTLYRHLQTSNSSS